MKSKLWGGRFTSAQSTDLDSYNSSLAFDIRMFKEDIQGSLAHSKMLAICGILSEADLKDIHDGLHAILKDYEAGTLEIDGSAEDIHSLIENELTRRIGDAGKRLHTARSRNDQVSLDLRLYLLKEVRGIRKLLHKLLDVTLIICKANLTTVMPGYTHLQRAQVVTLAHHLMAYVHMLLRDLERLEDWKRRTKRSPLGAGALATTSYPIDRETSASLLGFDSLMTNSQDAVSDRDFVIELAGNLALIMVHLSRWSEEIILWSSHEFGFMTLSDAYSTGSSIMPQKKNPDIAELTRGKAGRTIGNLTTLLTMMKGIPLAYNKDMQEDKEAIFDSVDTIKLCLPAFTGMLETAAWNTARMREACRQGFLGATDLADYLVVKGIPFRNAHEISGHLVNVASERGIGLEDFDLKELQAVNPAFEADIYDVLDLETMVNRRAVIGGPAASAVSTDIDAVSLKLETLAQTLRQP